jgi:hypothetical protein
MRTLLPSNTNASAIRAGIVSAMANRTVSDIPLSRFALLGSLGFVGAMASDFSNGMPHDCSKFGGPLPDAQFKPGNGVFRHDSYLLGEVIWVAHFCSPSRETGPA